MLSLNFFLLGIWLELSTFKLLHKSLKWFKLSVFGCHISFFRLLGYEGVEVINPEGGKEDAEEEAQRGRWKQEACFSHFRFILKF